MSQHDADRESAEDLAHEKIVLDAVARWKGCQWTKIETFGKYSIDCWFVSGNKMMGWGEAKWLSKEGFYGLNSAKYVQGCANALATGSPFYYCCRVPGKIGVVVVHNGVWAEAPTTSSVCGKDKGNWDDIEPMIMFEHDSIVWIKER